LRCGDIVCIDGIGQKTVTDVGHLHQSDQLDNYDTSANGCGFYGDLVGRRTTIRLR
jgi:hypothetical protein